MTTKILVLMTPSPIWFSPVSEYLQWRCRTEKHLTLLKRGWELAVESMVYPLGTVFVGSQKSLAWIHGRHSNLYLKNRGKSREEKIMCVENSKWSGLLNHFWIGDWGCQINYCDSREVFPQFIFLKNGSPGLRECGLGQSYHCVPQTSCCLWGLE